MADWFPMAAPPLPGPDLMRDIAGDGYTNEAHARGTVGLLRAADHAEGIDYSRPVEQARRDGRDPYDPHIYSLVARPLTAL